MSVLRFSGWQKICEGALEERDPEKLLQRVIVAETAIFRRLRGLRSRPEKVELEAMDTMLVRLRRVVTKASKVPGSEEKAARGLLRNPNNGLRRTVAKRRTRPFA
jgi:hypothetical protein